jgi:hypothetical protein
MAAAVQASAEKSAASVVDQAKDMAAKVGDTVQSAVDTLTPSSDNR